MTQVRSSLFLALGLTVLYVPASAGDIRDQMEIRTGKAELVIPDPNPQKIANDVKEALNEWSIPAKMNFRTLPSTIPARPDEPEAAQVVVQGTPAIEYRCKTAYAEIIKSPPAVNNAFMYTKEFTQACVYPFQKGVKVFLIFNTAKKTESLTSGLFSGIAKAIRGDDAEYMTKQLKKSIEDVRKQIPNLLVARLEVPGQAVQEPDKAAVAALIPAKVEAPPPQVVVVPPPAAAVPLAAAPAPANSMAAKIEARKSLAAIGLTYHAYDQFIAAIKRKDDVAVQLYVDAGAIDVSTKDKNGKTALDIAKDVGAPAIVNIIEAQMTGQSAPPAPPAAPAAPQAAPAQPAAAPAAATTSSDRHAIAAEAEKQLPPDIVSGIDQQLATMNLNPDQRQAMRDQALINANTQLAAFKKLAERIDPESGQLRQ